MGDVHDLWRAIRAQLIAATGLPDAQVMIDITPQGTTSNVAKNTNTPVISIFDLGVAKNTTRWGKVYAPIIAVPTQASYTVPPGLLPAGGAVPTLVGKIGTGFVANDAIGITVWNGNESSGAAVPVVLPGETPTSLALKLVNEINQTEPLNQWIMADAVGPVVTINNLLAIPLTMDGLAGNIAKQLFEAGREERVVQVSLWTANEADRETYGNLIRNWIGETQINFGLQLPDTAWVRIKMNSNQVTRDTHLADLYRWTFMLDCDMGIVVPQTLYSVLAINSKVDGSTIVPSG